jgi:hypothetical protein
MSNEWSFRDEEGEVHGYYDTETMQSWLAEGYIASDTEVQRRVDTERGVEEYEWLGLVNDLIGERGFTQESSWYYKVVPDGAEHGPYGLYILRAWITEEMLDYETLLAKCANAGELHEHKRQAWQVSGHFDDYSLFCEIEDVFGGGGNDGEGEARDEDAKGGEGEEEEEEEEEEESGDPVKRSFKRASMEKGIVGGVGSLDRSLLEGDTAADRNKMFFEQMKKEREMKEQRDSDAREAKLASMDEEEREKFLAAEAASIKHDKDKAKMLKRQLKGFSKKTKAAGKKKGRRGTKMGKV